VATAVVVTAVRRIRLACRRRRGEPGRRKGRTESTVRRVLIRPRTYCRQVITTRRINEGLRRCIAIRRRRRMAHYQIGLLAERRCRATRRISTARIVGDEVVIGRVYRTGITCRTTADIIPATGKLDRIVEKLVCSDVGMILPNDELLDGALVVVEVIKKIIRGPDRWSKVEADATSRRARVLNVAENIVIERVDGRAFPYIFQHVGVPILIEIFVKVVMKQVRRRRDALRRVTEDVVGNVVEATLANARSYGI